MKGTLFISPTERSISYKMITLEKLFTSSFRFYKFDIFSIKYSFGTKLNPFYTTFLGFSGKLFLNVILF